MTSLGLHLRVGFAIDTTREAMVILLRYVAEKIGDS